MNAAQLITAELRRRERRSFFVALRQYLLIVAGYVSGVFALYLFVVVWLSLDVLFG